MCEFHVKVTERDWSEDEKLLALQSVPKPPPSTGFSCAPGTPPEQAVVSPLADESVDEPAVTPA